MYIKISQWMQNYPALSERFLEELNRQNRVNPIPEELLSRRRKYELLKNFGFETYAKNFLKEELSLDNLAASIFVWWIIRSKEDYRV